ncbi:hypothetical protein LX64_03082 [Chitinophaga skermanii]|uniref:Uncharacterized protein n=1 Tax=Chitinophaga skermanii TaxID=331697 RepID=A0A327QKG9_9BACT|nr:hypothetical protein LX64_03082 [Chitinophaga skermanii]
MKQVLLLTFANEDILFTLNSKLKALAIQRSFVYTFSSNKNN